VVLLWLDSTRVCHVKIDFNLLNQAKRVVKMSNLSIQVLLKRVQQLTRSEKKELLDSLTRELLEDVATETDLNLADFFQNSPLIGIDIDLSRQL
jgi:hypothetical protein